MTAETHRPARHHLRPAAFVAAAVGLVLASYGVAAFHATAPGTAKPLTGAVQPGAVDGNVGDGALAGDGSGVSLPSSGGPLLAVGSLEQIDHSIATWTSNLAKEPKDFYSATNLGQLYEGRARLTGDIADFDRARQALEQAIAVAPDQTAARVVHARVLASLHDFPAALAEASSVFKLDPTQLPALATEGDAALELGDVATATASYDALAKVAPGAAIDARLSRLAFIDGDPAKSWQLATRAYDEAVATGETGPSLSWYAYVPGTLAISAGRPQQALDWFRRAVAAWPGSFLANAGVGRAEAALGRTDDAIRDYRAAIAIAPQPDVVAALGDLYALRGDATLSTQQYDTVEAIAHLAAINAQVFNRQLVLFSVNHGRDLPEALRLADQELAVRKDAYGYDADAWALLANGRAADADAAMQHALAFGTVDPLLEYHAGLIDQALGRTAEARRLLAAAVGATGALDPLAATRAEAALGALR